MPASEPNFDARMVDWLYDELDPAEVESFEKHLEANPAVLAEANALRRTREAFREMDQSEPSAGLSSMLMHEAARAVAQSPSLWARLTAFMQPVFLHPAASAMATLVVVAGVAGALYSRNGDMSVQPTAEVAADESLVLSADKSEASPERALRPAATPTSINEEASAAEGGEGRYDKDGFSVGLASDDAEGDIQAAEESLGKERSKRQAESDPSDFENQWGSGDSFADGVDSSEPEVRERDNAPAADLGRVTGGRGYAEPPPGAKQEQAPALKANAKKKVASPRGIPAENKSAATVTTTSKGGTATEDKKSADSISWEDEKARVLNAAAKDKRCLEAGRIANDILDKKPTFYKNNIQGSKAVSDCGKYVASETQRRAKVRKQQAAKASKKAAGTPTNAKASPQDETRSEALD